MAALCWSDSEDLKSLWTFHSGNSCSLDLDDTIVAISTPPGRGGIGVVRLAGPQARVIAEGQLRLPRPLEANRAVFAGLLADSERIDEVVVTFFAAPHSYTTDDLVEISAHGSPIVLRTIVEQSLARGARLAEPGEFTMRAFLRGRIDLTQAEAVRDLIDAQTLHQARSAAQQLGGAVARELRPPKDALVHLIAELEAGIDFAEDDVATVLPETIRARIAAVSAPLERLARSFAAGRLLREGMTLAIVGRPNVGKSSLFNCLIEREHAIVTAAPGTTRDLVTETVALGGIPVRLVDTAGIRAAADEAESIGIRKSYEALAAADLVLLVLDAATIAAGTVEKFSDVRAQEVQAASLVQTLRASLSTEDDELFQRTEGRPRVVVLNKCDLADSRADAMAPQSEHTRTEDLCVIRTSALTGEGLGTLRGAILSRLGGDSAIPQDSAMLTNVRHKSLVDSSLHALESAAKANQAAVPHEMLLLDLYAALRPLDEITGHTTADDILNVIFGSFCIGK